jgi:group I intron endonuclease
MGYIYRITNTIDGKRYIGQTKCDDVETRWKQHKKVDRHCIGPYLFNAYSKHGIENFKFEIVCVCFDEDCDKYEKEYILKFNTITPNGYNIKLGPTFSKHTVDSKELIRQKMKEKYKTDEKFRSQLRNYTRAGAVTSVEHKEKLRITSKRYWETMTEDKYKEICDKRRENYKKREALNPIIRNISGLSVGWKAQQKRVGKFDLSDNLVEEYESVMIAAERVGLHHATIRKVCRGKKHYHTAGGFKWKFL